MDLLAGLIAAAGFAAVPAAGFAWVVERWRSRRRNGEGRCAICALAWADIETEERFLIHGRLVCESCATVARKRVVWHFGLLSGFALFASGMILFKDGLDWFALVPPTFVALGTMGAAGLMKLQNRRAQEEIAAGSYPFLLSAADTDGGQPARIEP